MSSFKEQLEKLQSLRRRLAIWEAIHYLIDEKFISKDGRKVSGIKLPDSGEPIPEDEIEDVLQSIGSGPIAELQAEIASIEEQEVVVLGNKAQA